MQVICKTTGKDMTSWLLNKWENERKDKLIEELMTKELNKKEFDKELNKITKC
mgnify:CR=1 FL=1